MSKTREPANKHVPTEKDRQYVRSMSAYGVPQADIATVLGITRQTLAVHYREELDRATTEANAKVAQTLFAQATDKDNPRSVTAAIFWLKTRAGWRETSVHEITGADGGPVQVDHVQKLRDFLKK